MKFSIPMHEVTVAQSKKRTKEKTMIILKTLEQAHAQVETARALLKAACPTSEPLRKELLLKSLTSLESAIQLQETIKGRV